ncbi:hypothetical protein SNE40_010645 [Patella caerulea]|uniref:G-protein coupled receptors family 1 profile domain-containing protein n=2 Tax=Patella caerulea TaxID=87958 RepID=A0AAN8Q0I0_PATCE
MAMEIKRESGLIFNLSESDFSVHNENHYNNSKGSPSHVWNSETAERVAVVSFIMICTILGNTTLILTILCKHSRRIKRVNIFLLNLAIGDLAVACFTNTTEILFLAFDEWILGPVLCKVSVYLQIVTFSSATFLLMAMSIDRYQVIVRPLQALASRPRIGRKVLLAWVMAFIFASPQLLIFVQVEKGTKFDGTPRRACLSHGYTAEWQRKIYFTYMTLYILVIPSSVMLYCYINIISVVWSRGQSHHRQAETLSEEEPSKSPRISVRRGLVTAAKRRAVILTLTVIIGYLSCLTPYFIITLIRIYSNYAVKLKKPLAVAESIFMTHSALNPILYGLFTLRRRHVRRAVKRFSCCNKQVKKTYEKNRLLNGSAGSYRKTVSHAKGNCPTDESFPFYLDRHGKRAKTGHQNNHSNQQELSLLDNAESEHDVITLRTGDRRSPRCVQWFGRHDSCQTQCLSSV